MLDNNCKFAFPIITVSSKEISAPYEQPHYPIEVEEHRKQIGNIILFLSFSFSALCCLSATKRK